MLKRSFNPDSRLPKPTFHRTCSADRQSSGQVSGRKIILLLLIGLFISTITFADYRITRGPDIGEIYFVGPTATGEGIYHSTDFGETAVCVDSISEVESICADLTPGSLYRVRMPDCLYYSNNYGQYGSWVFRHSNIFSDILSGKNNGFIYNGITAHSEDYGINFIPHTCNGYFGLRKTSEIDNQDNVGYAIVYILSVYDSLYLLISYDNFDSLEIKNKFNWVSAYNFTLSRGTEPGELYLLRFAFTGDGSRITELWYSSNFGENWTFKNHLLSNYIVGGRQPGELFVLAEYIQLMGEIKHTFIYHSLDYGETFTVFHPFSYGPSPFYANFEAEPTSGEVPLTVQFTDLSSGDDIQSWEWDFQNDGIIDSYEQNPEYTYQDTGYYSVKLRIQHVIVEDAFIRTDYIHATESNGINNDTNLNPSNTILNNYPNPFDNSTTIYYSITPNLHEEAQICIYNIKGRLIKTLPISTPQFIYNQSSITNVSWDGKDESGKKVSSGIYFYKLRLKNSPIKKMLLIR